MQLSTTNLGDDAFTYSCAIHSYFSISDLNHVELVGLEGQYLDKTRDYQSINTPTPYLFKEETDRVHLHQPKSVSIVNGQNITEVLSSGHDSMVVWNPWREKSKSMKDMTDKGYQSMLCVETAITQGHIVEAGQTHVLQQIVN